jgi:hypothetical protein
MLTNGVDRSINDRLKRVEGELLSLVQSAVEPGKGDQKISHFPFDITYNGIRRLLTDKILNNKDLLGTPPIFQLPPTYGMPIMPAGAALTQLPQQVVSPL